MVVIHWNAMGRISLSVIAIIVIYHSNFINIGLIFTNQLVKSCFEQVLASSCTTLLYAENTSLVFYVSRGHNLFNHSIA